MSADDLGTAWMRAHADAARQVLAEFLDDDDDLLSAVQGLSLALGPAEAAEQEALRAARRVIAALDERLEDQHARRTRVEVRAEQAEAAIRRAHAVPVDAPAYYDANTAHGWEAGRNAVLDAIGETP